MKNCLIFPLLLISILYFTSCDPNPSGKNAEAGGLSLQASFDSLQVIEKLILNVKSKDHENALILANNGLNLAWQSGSDSLVALASLLKGLVYRNYQEDSAFFYTNQALKLCEKHGYTRLMPMLYYNLSNIYGTASDVRTAIRLLDSCIHLASESRHFLVLSNAYNYLGNIHFELHDTSDARRLLDTAYRIALRHGLNGQIGVSLASLSHLEPNPEKSLKMQLQALSYLRKTTGFDEEIATILINIGADASHPDTSMYYLQKGIESARNSNKLIPLITGYNNLAYSYLEKNQLREAESCLKDHAIPIAKQMNNNDWLSTLYDSYMDVKLAEGDLRSALTYEQLALRTRIAAHQQQAADQVRLLSALLESRNKEIRIQKSEAEILNQRNRTQWIIGWFSTGILLILVIVLLILRKMQQKHLDDQARMLVSARKLIESEEARKGRIALELHDMITPFYYGMMQKLESSGIRNDQLKSEFEQTLSGLSSALRDISHRMNSEFVKQFDIREMILGLCEDFRKTTPLTIHCPPIHLTYSLSDEEKLHVYRITQELLSNAVKYVKTGNVFLTFSETQDRVLLMYRDDGPGFDSDSEDHRGLGIVSIHERALLLNGKAILHSSVGKGTTWTISIPRKHKLQIQTTAT